MSYILLTTEPPAPPVGFDLIESEDDGDDGLGRALWLVTHSDSATLSAWASANSLAPIQEGVSWNGDDMTRRHQGTALVRLRGKLAAARDIATPAVRAYINDAIAELPTDPRA